MDLMHEIVLSWLEEDNTQRAYFRLKPLLTVSGDAQEEAAKLWPEDGALRIVPDKNEQGYFKDRMRAMGNFCLMDLTPFPAEANKIRTNKNFRPDRDERNQYILYSDAVKAVPSHTFYEVLEGAPENAETLAATAATPLFLIRQEDVLYGPVDRQNPATPEHAPEMEAVVYDVPCPDGKQRVILCKKEIEQTPAEPKAEAKVAPVPEEKTESTGELPIGKTLNILDENKDFAETLEGLNQPLSHGANLLHHRQEESAPVEPIRPQQLTGTPLMRSAGLHTSVPRPKNYVQEVVANQMRAVRNDPPAAPLPSGVTMRAVDNPVERACTYLQQAWQMPEAQQQLVDFVLSLPGMSARIVPTVTASQGKTPLQQALQHRLEDLEAERLAALIQLDKARDDLEKFRKNALETASGEASRKLREAEAQLDAYTKQKDALAEQVSTLAKQRDAVEEEVERLRQNDYASALAEALNRAQLVAPVAGQALRMHTHVGTPTPLSELAKRLAEACKANQTECSYNAATALLGALTVCTHVGVATETMAAAATLAENLTCAMGWHAGYALQTATNQTPVPDTKFVEEATPMLLLSTLTDVAPAEPACTVTLVNQPGTLTGMTSYAVNPYPIFSVPALSYVAEMLTEGAPLSMEEGKKKFTEESFAAVRSVLTPVLKTIAPLSGKAAKEMEHFVLLCAEAMEGGLSAACDWAIKLWVMPQVSADVAAKNQLRSLLVEYPQSLAML